MAKLLPLKKSKYVCYLCHEKIEDEELEYEDYYRVCRGHNTTGDFYLCFECGQDIMNKQKEHSILLETKRKNLTK